MKKQLARLSLVLILVSLACGLPAYGNAPIQPSPRAVSQLLTTPDPNATATATPFQPVGPTITPTITQTPVASGTPEDMSGIPGLPTPIRVPGKLPDGSLSFLILGNDWRPNSGYRTDVMQLVTINGKQGTVSIVSFPRDLYVTIPGWTTQRINTAFAHGGFSMMADTFQYNFGVRPSFYIMTNFQGFEGIINSLGGVNVHVGQYLSDKCDLPQAEGGYCTVNSGTVPMDGATALWYIRSRHTTNDLDRGRRAQEVLYAIFNKMMNLNAITRLPELYKAYRSSVETDMNIETIAPYLPVASLIFSDSSRVHRYTIGINEVIPYTTPSGAMVLLPKYEAISAMLNEAIFNQ